MAFHFVFLEAHVPLTKRFTATTKEPYPNAFEFKSHHYDLTSLSQLHVKLTYHASLGHCLLKGQLNRAPLEWESRAHTTNPTSPTYWLCLDLDSVTSVASIQAFLTQLDPGLVDVSYILQWSASHGVIAPGCTIAQAFPMRAHIFILLTNPVSPPILKLWLKQANLTKFASDLRLTKSNVALLWPLDITTCQNDKLIFISPPHCTPKSLDVFSSPQSPFYSQLPDRITLIQPPNFKPSFDFSTVTPTLLPTDILRGLEEKAINDLRKTNGLSERKANKFKLKGTANQYLPNPDQAVVTGIKSEREFVYLNLNGGDSWAYFHPEENPEFIHNFKGEPSYKTSELLPDYWADLQHAKAQKARQARQGKLILAFRDFKTAEYFNGWYDENTEDLTLQRARSEIQLRDFLLGLGQPVPDAIPIWTVDYDPTAPVIDLAKCTVNTFRPSTYMRFSRAQAHLLPANPSSAHFATPGIDRLFIHVVGEAMYPSQFNWLAFIYQKRVAPGTAWIWHGAAGTGKGLLANEVLTPLLGPTNISQKRMEELEDRYNEHLENTLLCFVDEAQIADSHRSQMIMANLKNQITEPKITIRRMRTAAYETTNRVGWIFASNKPDPVQVDSGDRRFYVGEYQPNPIRVTAADVLQLRAELQAFANRLETHKVDFAAVRTPVHTETKAQMIMVSRNSADTVAEAITEGNMQALWDALPTVDIGDVGYDSGVKVPKYKALLQDLILTGRDKISREELFIIFNYNVGNVPSSPWKLTSYLKHHGLQIKDIRIGDRVTKGVATKWTSSTEWLDARKKEITEELPALRLIKNNKIVG